MTDQVQKPRIQQLIDGDIAPPNDFVGYIVQKLRDSNADLEHLHSILQNGRRRVAELETEILRTQGKAASTLEDLKIWDAKAQAAEAEESDDVKDKTPRIVVPDKKILVPARG